MSRLVAGWLALVAVATFAILAGCTAPGTTPAGSAAIRSVAPLAMSTPHALSAPSPIAVPEPTLLDGLPVMTVSEALAAHEQGVLPGDRAAIRGFWSNGEVPSTCVLPENTGDLELWCSDGEYGITELEEQILVLDAYGYGVSVAQGPHLTPYFPEGVEGLELKIGSHPQYINGQLYPPFPVVVLGHFNDPMAAECRKQARELCRDRLVVDRIVRWDVGAVPTPGVTPTPTPFPSPGPSGRFEPAACAGDIPYSFVGWTTFEELGIDLRGYGHIWVAISRDPVDRGDGEWIESPTGHRYRGFARVICYQPEWQREGPGIMGYESVPGSDEIHWEDGLITPGTTPVRPS